MLRSTLRKQRSNGVVSSQNDFEQPLLTDEPMSQPLVDLDDDDLPPETQLTTRSMKRPHSQKKGEETDIMKRARTTATVAETSETVAVATTTAATTARNTTHTTAGAKENIVSLPTPSPPHLSQLPSSYEPIYTQQQHASSQPILSSRPSQYNSNHMVSDYTPLHRRNDYGEPHHVETIRTEYEQLKAQYRSLEARYQALEKNYEDLALVRDTEAETLYKHYKQNAEERIQTMEAVISEQKEQLMRREVDYRLLKRDLEQGKIPLKHQQPQEQSDIIREKDEQIQELWRKLQGSQSEQHDDLSKGMKELQTSLTGFSILEAKVVTNGNTVYKCVQQGRHGIIHFKLIHTQEDKIVYRPLLDASRDAGLIQRLPDFLTHDIVFRKDILGLFHWKLCQTLQNVDTSHITS